MLANWILVDNGKLSYGQKTETTFLFSGVNW